jgi:hypothetical protein
MFQMVPVVSSQIQSIGFDPVQKVMRIQFNRGGLYEYQNVEPETYSTILTAESVGAEFDKLVKKQPDKYPYQKV